MARYQVVVRPFGPHETSMFDFGDHYCGGSDERIDKRNREKAEELKKQIERHCEDIADISVEKIHDEEG